MPRRAIDVEYKIVKCKHFFYVSENPKETIIMDEMPTTSCVMTEEAKAAVNQVVDILLNDEHHHHDKIVHFLEHDAIPVTLYAVANELLRRWKAEPRKKAGRRAHTVLQLVLGMESTQNVLRQCPGYNEYASRKFTAFSKKINGYLPPPRS